MNSFQESGLQFTFPKDWLVIKYDEHRFYHYLSGIGFKGVDFIILTPEKKLILIEVKNYKNRFPSDGINPSETLLNDTSTFSKTFVNKFQDTFKLLKIVRKYLGRKKWFTWSSKILKRFFPYSIFIKTDYGFWIFANEYLENNDVELILWLELSDEINIQKKDVIHRNILSYFNEMIPPFSFQILNQKSKPSFISTPWVND